MSMCLGLESIVQCTIEQFGISIQRCRWHLLVDNMPSVTQTQLWKYIGQIDIYRRRTPAEYFVRLLLTSLPTTSPVPKKRKKQKQYNETKTNENKKDGSWRMPHGCSKKVQKISEKLPSVNTLLTNTPTNHCPQPPLRTLRPNFAPVKQMYLHDAPLNKEKNKNICFLQPHKSFP